MLSIIKEVSDFEFKNELWSGAVDTAHTVLDYRKADELMQLMEELFYEPTDMTTINDFLWFESDYIYEALGIFEGMEGED